MKKLYKKIVRFFTTQTIPSKTVSLETTLFKELYKDPPKPFEFTKQQEKKIKQFIRLEVRKQLNKKK